MVLWKVGEWGGGCGWCGGVLEGGLFVGWWCGWVGGCGGGLMVG